MPQQRLRALQQILRALVERPEPGALVVACGEYDLFYVLYLLDRLDEESPHDRFFLVAEAFTNSADYVEMLATTARGAVDLTDLPGPDHPPTPRLLALIDHLLAGLPPGDHRLVVALVPSEMGDHLAFSALAHALLEAPFDARLRLVLRDDPARPQHFTTVAQSASTQQIAYSFSLSPDLILAATQRTAHDPGRSPDERAQALIQLACRDLGHGHVEEALARCEAAARLPAAAPIQALVLAIQADVMRRSGDTDAALRVGLAALRLAVDNNALMVVQHASLALGELTRDLGRTEESAACFELMHRAAIFNPDVQARARTLPSALELTHVAP